MSIKQFRGFKKIILTTDFSDASDNASSCALSMAEHYDATLHIVHVVDTSTGDEDFYAPSAKLDTEMVASAESMLEKKVLQTSYKFVQSQVGCLYGHSA